MTVPQHRDRISPNMARKGARLHRDGHVHYAGQVDLYPVQGDTRDEAGHRVVYAVFSWNGAWHCTCPAHGACKHIAAVLDARKAGTGLKPLEAAARRSRDRAGVASPVALGRSDEIEETRR